MKHWANFRSVGLIKEQGFFYLFTENHYLELWLRRWVYIVSTHTTRHFLCCADVVIIALMVHSPLKKTRKGTRDGRKKMQIFSYVFRLQKTEATSSTSRNKIALCAC